MDFDRIERRETTFDTRRTTSVGDTIEIQRCFRTVPNKYPTPVTRGRCCGTLVARRIERAAETVTSIVDARHDDRQSYGTFGNHVCTVFDFDARSTILNNRTWIDDQATIEPRPNLGRQLHQCVATHCAVIDKARSDCVDLSYKSVRSATVCIASVNPTTNVRQGAVDWGQVSKADRTAVRYRRRRSRDRSQAFVAS